MKNKLRYSFLLSVICYLFPVASFTQDIHFSQYSFSNQQLNPAFTAVYKTIQVTVQHKEQWRMVNAFRTSAAGIEYKFGHREWEKMERMTGTFKKRLMKGLAGGLNFFSDKAGDGSIRTTQVNLSLAYHTRLNEKHILSMGILGGFVQRSISPDKLRWNNQYSGGAFDPNLSPGENFSNSSFIYPDLGGGILWSYGDGDKYMSSNDQKHFHAGVSLMHINKPSISFLGNDAEKLNWKWTAHAGSLFGIKNTTLSLGPSILFMSQGPQTEITPGMCVKYQFKETSKYTGYVKGSAMTLGCYYRNRDAVIPYFMIEMDKYSLGISYDTNISGLTNVTDGRGGIEISLRFNSPSSFLYQTKSRI